MSSSTKKHNLYISGLVLIAVSYIAYLLKKNYFPGQDFFDANSFFWINFLICIGYFLVVQIDNMSQKPWRFLHIEDRLYSNMLILFSISAHSLNTELTVFAPYVEWLSVVLFVMHLSWLAFPYRDKLPFFAQYVLYMICGLGLAVSIYMTIYMLPIATMGFMAFWFFGIPAHGTITVWYAVTFASYPYKKMSRPDLKQAFIIGFSVAILFSGMYLFRWQQVQSQIEDAQQSWTEVYDQSLPLHQVLAQRLPKSYFTKKILMSQIQNPRGWATLDRLNINATDVHDPFALIAQMFFGKLQLSQKNAMMVLKSQYGEHHIGIRRLWRGDDLRTRRVESDIHIYPAYRMAYAQKLLYIHNEDESRWARQQEAIYTFHLPEGAVVTSLSLWVNDKERQSRLSTRAKADSAYLTIVGRERRDPALLHWQEGNRVTVTVFPCTAAEDRVFKIGLSMPLRLEGEKLVLDDFSFQGPPPNHASEVMRVTFEGETPHNLDLPFRLRKQDDGSFVYKGKYLSNRSFSFEKPLLGKGNFTFNGKKVSVSTFTPEPFSFSPKTVILDGNKAWTKRNWIRVWNRVKDKEVFVFLPQKTEVTAENYMDVFKQLHKFQFSLVPLHEIDAPTQTLIISQSPKGGPILSALDGSSFAKSLQRIQLEQPFKPKLFNLGHQLSPYWQSLKAFHLLDYAEGDMNELDDLLANNQFWVEPADDHQVCLTDAKMKLVLEPDSSTNAQNEAPDHIFRLFAYNDLLRKIGRQYFDREALEEHWVRQAEEAFVVSPISSLIVLETDDDYDRFDIAENENTLDNVQGPKKVIKNTKNFGKLIGTSGAAPEPHEWVLIVLVGMVAVWQVFKNKF